MRIIFAVMLALCLSNISYGKVFTFDFEPKQGQMQIETTSNCDDGSCVIEYGDKNKAEQEPEYVQEVSEEPPYDEPFSYLLWSITGLSLSSFVGGASYYLYNSKKIKFIYNV